MSWIKLETHIFDKPEVYQIANDTRLDPDAVVAKCCRIWIWFDANTVDGVCPEAMQPLLDRHAGKNGFCKAMQKAGWMLIVDGEIKLPYYDRHNSKTAKSRALGAKRQAKFKEKSNAQGNAKCNAIDND